VGPAARRSGPVKGPLEQVPPRSRVHASLERVPPRSRVTPPSSGFRLARGITPPSSGFRLARGIISPSLEAPHEHTCSRTRVRAFNVLTRQSHAIMRLGITPRRCSANSLGETHPRHCWGLCDMTSVSSVALCFPLPYANALRPRRGGGHTLEPLSHESAGSNHDVRPAGRHPRHCWSCAAAPMPAAPRRALLQQLQRCWARGDGTPPRLPLYPVRITVNGFLEPV
jgi:hypothetical protein